MCLQNIFALLVVCKSAECTSVCMYIVMLLVLFKIAFYINVF